MARGSVARCGVSGSGIASRELRDGRDAKAGRYASLILRSPPPEVICVREASAGMASPLRAATRFLTERARSSVSAYATVAAGEASNNITAARARAIIRFNRVTISP